MHPRARPGGRCRGVAAGSARPLRDAPPDLLHVGSTIPRKRIDVLLEVVAAVRRAEPGARLLKAGGSLTAEQERLARSLGLADAVVTLPFLTRRTLAALYRRAAVVLQPSEAEGFGLPVAEALACGVPIVASDLDASPRGRWRGRRLPPGRRRAGLDRGRRVAPRRPTRPFRSLASPTRRSGWTGPGSSTGRPTPDASPPSTAACSNPPPDPSSFSTPTGDTPGPQRRGRVVDTTRTLFDTTPLRRIIAYFHFWRTVLKLDSDIREFGAFSGSW